MERYNISIRRPPQVFPLVETSTTELPQSARWPDAFSKSSPSTVFASVAVLLHLVVGAALLAIIRLPVVPKLSEEQAVALVFAPPQAASPAQLAPAVIPAPPPPDEIPAPPEVPVAQPSPPEPLPPPPTETKTPEAPPQIARPPVVHKIIPRAKPAAPPHIAETPTAVQPQPSDAPPGQPTSRSSAAEAPIAGDWQRSLANWLAAHKTYPDEARRRGTEGSVVLRFTADRSGRVLDVVLVRSAGSSMLDAAAEAMVRDAALPPFTAGMSQDTVTVTVQIRYALAN